MAGIDCDLNGVPAGNRACSSAEPFFSERSVDQARHLATLYRFGTRAVTALPALQSIQTPLHGSQ